ncbi:hypothetical protein [Carboxylicivirga marina]|uniref:Capsid protein n=1 Tax=Carboxylicivirga marina TaxID=2800988 RepID=A0ABS1HGB8_9BACT|nr:hypothetical protein [Carboxylicivirga marina]MBK3516714.1 hypothetical protein [Carboxylicivirga marina]
MALPETGINTTLIRNILAASSNKLSELCKHANVNMYSKRKPITENSNAAEWWKGLNNDFGLSVPQYVEGGTSADWSYTKPMSAFKMGHFRLYEHNAIPPIANSQQTREINKWYGNISYLGLLLTRSGESQIGYDDGIMINNLALPDYYLGVELENSVGSKVVLTATAKLGNSGEVEVDWNNALISGWLGAITARYFVSRYTKTINGSFPVGFWDECYCIPNSNGSYNEVAINLINQSAIDFSVVGAGNSKTGYFDPGGKDQPLPISSLGSVGIKMTVTNDSTETYTIRDYKFEADFITTYFGYSYTLECTGSMYDSSGNALASFSLAPGASKTIVLYNVNVLNRDSSGVKAVTPGMNEAVSINVRYNGGGAGGGVYDFTTS